jgi:hypothetical protein
MINRLAIVALVGSTLLWMRIGCTGYRRECARRESDHIAAIEAARDLAHVETKPRASCRVRSARALLESSNEE